MRHFATTIAMMGDAAEVLEQRGTPLCPDVKFQIEKETEGFVVSRAFFLSLTNNFE